MSNKILVRRYSYFLHVCGHRVKEGWSKRRLGAAHELENRHVTLANVRYSTNKLANALAWASRTDVEMGNIVYNLLPI